MGALVVGESEGNPVDIGPVLAVLRSPSASAKQVAQAMRDVRLDLYESDQGTAGWALVDAVPHFVKVLKGKASTHAKAAILELFADIHPNVEEVDSPDPEALAKNLAAAKSIAKTASTDKKLSAAAKRFLTAWTLEPRAPAAPATVRRRLDDTLAKAILQVVEATKAYAPDKLVATLAKLAPGERVDLVMDLIGGKSGVESHWTYGGGVDITMAERRRARVHDLCLRLLADADPARLDAEIAALQAAEDKLPSNVAPGDQRRRPFWEPRALLALARARGAGGKLPPKLVVHLDHVWGCGRWFRDVCSPAVIQHFSKRPIAPRWADTLVWLTDLSPKAAAAVAKAGLSATDRPNIVDEFE